MKTNSVLRFVLDNRICEVDFSQANLRPSTTVLNYLRALTNHKGTKEGCAEGDCGACTVVLGELDADDRIHYKAIDSCMTFLASIHGKQIITVENLALRQGAETILHPVQQAMVHEHGSQCGFCTPGIVMSLFAFYKSKLEPNRENIIDHLAGNLCRCTGYEAIIKATRIACANRQPDHFDVNEPMIVNLLREIKGNDASLALHHSKQTYFLPDSIDLALQLLTENPDATLVNGTTDVAIRQNKKHEFLTKVIDLSALTELKFIHANNNGFHVGAGTTLESLKRFSEQNIPELKPILNVFASHQIRNVATVGGNLCTASPIGDLIPLMFALKARFEIVSTANSRIVDAEDFIVGYRKNCLLPNEILKGVIIPRIDSNVLIWTEKVSNRRDLDISTVSLAARLRVDAQGIVKEIMLVYGGMAEVTKRARHVENYLIGKEWSRENIENAKKHFSSDFTPISDARASKEYRLTVAENLLLKLFVDCN